MIAGATFGEVFGRVAGIAVIFGMGLVFCVGLYICFEALVNWDDRRREK